MNYEVLWNELTVDPAGVGYTDPLNEANDNTNVGLLNNAEQLVDRTSITAIELWENTDLAEYAALSAAARQAYSVLVDLGTIDVSIGSNSRATLAALFPAGSATRANLVALAGEQIRTNRAVILGLGKVYVHDIETARKRFN